MAKLIEYVCEYVFVKNPNKSKKEIDVFNILFPSFKIIYTIYMIYIYVIKDFLNFHGY